MQHINRTKNKTHMIRSIDIEKASMPFDDKSSEEARSRRNAPQHNKVYLQQT
jgi:hypothetical protein